MSPELQKYYESRFDMCATDGWNDLIEDVKAMIEATNRLDGIESESQLWLRKGELSIMQWLVSLRDISEQAYEDLKNENA